MLMNKFTTRQSANVRVGYTHRALSVPRPVLVRAQEPEQGTPQAAPQEPQQPQGPLSPAEQEIRATQAVAAMQAQQKPPPGSKEADANSILNNMNEAINGRAAMMGFVFAIAGELATNHGVVSQVAGRYENQELVEKALAGSDLGFGAVVALTTIGTLMPRLIAGEAPGDRSFGPFTPGLEKALGRVAMMGFAGLLILEDVMGHPLL
ncbi:carotene biosynthesis-related protein [Dunaliella salina]|uniref:Carotene biosynthesis-related protein n=1 Tax=Dunaliella salina TaxID=3046 RepID=A0ABQ7H503_DUNSA|nr:carotene biosynthesis-related protein [Dunaliella salina]|eukprot:KAF5841908.1 carotene biosynthesis-related protein [Dunaliella salina]